MLLKGWMKLVYINALLLVRVVIGGRLKNYLIFVPFKKETTFALSLILRPLWLGEQSVIYL